MKKRGQWRAMRFRKGDPSHNLLAAVSQYVRANGGSAIVIGGIEIQEWYEGPYKYRVAVRCLGLPPKAPEACP